MRKAGLVMLGCFFAVTLRSQEVDLNGEWVMTFETPRGAQISEITITQVGNEATVKSGETEYVIAVEGEEVTWSRAIDTPLGGASADFEGSITTKNEMAGTASFSEGPLEGRSFSWTQ